MKELFVLNKYFYKYKWYILLGFVFVICANTFKIMQPNLVGNAIEAAEFQIKNPESPVDHSVYIKYGATLILYSIIGGLFTFLMRKTIIVCSRHIEYDIRNDIFEHYESLSSDFFKRNNTGDLMSRISEDVNKVRMYVGPALMYGINLIVLFSIAIPIMYRQSPQLTIYCLLPLPFLSLSIYLVSNVINKRSKAVQEHLASLNVNAQESFSGIRVIKSYVRELSMSSFFEKESDQYREKTMDLFKVEAVFFPLILLLTGASTIIALFVGGKLVMEGKSNLGDIARFIIYINMLTWPVTSVGWVAAIIQTASASQRRINEFMKQDPTIEDVENPKQIDKINTIQFENVTKIYADTAIEALTDLNLTIERGDKVALIGRTGSGKSTLAELLLRIEEVSGGKLTINGLPIEEIQVSSLRNAISYVPQDVFLFSDTVENNIRFSDDELTTEQIVQMAKSAAVHKDIISLRDGYDTLVGERGVTLSGGQKQRVAIARALIKKSDFILFDDCLSAVDANTEEQIIRYLREYLESKTSLFITHRLPKSIVFDKIIVLEEGKIEAIGTHAELMKKSSFYAELYNVTQNLENN